MKIISQCSLRMFLTGYNVFIYWLFKYYLKRLWSYDLTVLYKSIIIIIIIK